MRRWSRRRKCRPHTEIGRGVRTGVERVAADAVRCRALYQLELVRQVALLLQKMERRRGSSTSGQGLGAAGPEVVRNAARRQMSPRTM